MRLIDADKLGLTDFEILLCDGNYKEALKLLLKKIEGAETIELPEEKDKPKKKIDIPCKKCKNNHHNLCNWEACRETGFGLLEEDKELPDTTKTTPHDSSEDPAKIESSIKPGDNNDDLDLMIKEIEYDASIAELASKSNDPFYKFSLMNWNEKAKEKRQLAHWLKELKYYKENDNDELCEWVYRKDTDRMHCSNCGSSSAYDNYGPIQTPYCCYCGKKMLKGWDYHDPRRVDCNG